MKTVINNEGKNVQVSQGIYELMQQSFTEGVWSVLIRDNVGQPHTIMLGANFTY